MQFAQGRGESPAAYSRLPYGLKHDVSGGSSPQPTEPRRGAGLRPVLASDPAVVAQCVDDVEQVVVVQLAEVGLMPLGHAGDLQVADAAGGQVAAQPHRDVAFDDLAVVEVHL